MVAQISLTLSSHQKDGQVCYTFADAHRGKLYVGSAQNYKRYQELAAQQRMDREEYMATEMNEEEAMDWYMWGFYGPIW